MSTREEWIKTYPHLKDFFPFIDLLTDESERGKALISSGFLEEQLKQVLLAFMVDSPQGTELVEGGNVPLGTFSARITACYTLGLISKDEHDDLHLIRKIRNDFAHDIHTTFKTESVVNRCKHLKHKAEDYDRSGKDPVVVSPQGQFLTAATAIILHLANRPHYVSKQRRSYGNWPY